VIKKARTTCVIKGIKKGTVLSLRSQSKNKKGYGAKSTAVKYVAGAAHYVSPITPKTPVSPIVATPVGNTLPTAPVIPPEVAPVIPPEEPGEVLSVVNVPEISGLTIPVPGNSPDATVTAGTGYTASVTWSPNPAAFISNTEYTATLTLVATTGYTFTGVATNFFTVAGSSSNTNAVDSGVVTAIFPGVIYALGDLGPAGGQIFITPATNGNSTGKYFEAAAADLSATKAWCNASTDVGATGLVIGSGQANTALLAAACASGAGKDAADYEVTTDSVTYSDWFLPAQDELMQLCLFAKVVRPGTSTCNSSALKAGFAAGTYWSSSEATTDYAFSQNLSSGAEEFSSKNYPSNVRVVRAFS
jgi:hypothetical protein